jgi:hypothetical protein
MKRRRSRLITLLAGASMLLCLGISALWILTYLHGDEHEYRFERFSAANGVGHHFSTSIEFEHGTLFAIFSLQDYALRNPNSQTLPSGASGSEIDFSLQDPMYPLERNIYSLWRPKFYNRSGNRGVVFLLPLWFFALVTAILPAIRIFRIFVPRRIANRGLCEECGYDLRATPDRCPECGTVPAKKHANPA